MRAHELEREQDIEQLRRIALAQHAQIEQLIAALERKCRELETFKGSKDELQQTLALIGELVKQQQALAGKQNERAGADGGESKDDKPGDRPPKKRGTAATPQPTLRRTPLLCELPASELVCDSCGGELHKMADQFEESEMIDVVEVEYHVKQVMRQKYSCKCGGCIKTAPGPQRAIVGGRYSLDLAIKIIIDKYLYHLPLARQARIMAQHGLVITPQALWDQLYAVSQRLQITVAGLIKHVMEHPVIGLDQTSWPRLDGAGTKPWQMWCLTAPGAVVHRIRDDKSAATFKLLVGEYRGVIVCDALKTHEAGAREASHIVLAGCWAHYPDSGVIRRDRRATPTYRRQGIPAHRILRCNLQRRQEPKEVRLRPPRRSATADEACLLPERVEHVTLHLQVARDVPAGRSYTRVPEVVADDRDVHSGLEQRDGAAVPKDMRADARSSKNRVST